MSTIQDKKILYGFDSLYNAKEYKNTNPKRYRNKSKKNYFTRLIQYIQKIKIINCVLQNIDLISNAIDKILSFSKRIDIIYHIAGGGLGAHDPLINSKNPPTPSGNL